MAQTENLTAVGLGCDLSAKGRPASRSKPIPEGNEGSFILNTFPGNSETLPKNKKYCPKSKYKISKLCPAWN